MENEVFVDKDRTEAESLQLEEHVVTIEVSTRLARLLELDSRTVDLYQPLTEQQCIALDKIDKCGNTQLIISATKGEDEGEKGSIEFLTWYGTDINHRNKYGQTAIDVVWENELYDCMLLLLEADSDFPESFIPAQIDETDPTTQELTSFLKHRDQLHRWIEDGDVVNVARYVSQHRLSRFLNTHNVPAVMTAAKYGNAHILADLLKLPLPVPKGNILLSGSRLNLLKLTDRLGNTPLLLAAEAGNEEIVDFIIRCGAEINLMNQGKKKAVDLAWQNGHHGVVLLLLSEDSDFPAGLTTDNMSGSDNITKQLVSFVDSRDELHKFIVNGNFEAVKTFFNRHEQSSKYYCNRQGSSALFVAVKSHQFQICSYLVSKGIHFKDQLEGECLKELGEIGKAELNNYMIRYLSGAENAHILYLISKSKSMRPRDNFENEVKGFYCELGRIPEISIILQVVQYADNLEIAFDFDRKDVWHIDPRYSETTKGTTEFRSGRLIVGFKRETHIEESERLGTLAHELTHMAMQIIYNNDCNPFGKFDVDKQNQFKKLVRDIKKHCDNASEVEDIISRVFVDYVNYEHWPAELIVRIPQVLAKYGTDRGRDIIHKHVPLLYSFYRNHVMHACMEFVRESFLIKPRNMIKLLNQHLGVRNEFERMNIWFKQSYDLHRFLQSDKHILLLDTQSTLLSSISIYQALQTLPQYSLENNSMLIRMSLSEDIQNDIIYTFRSQACNLMVVEFHNYVKSQLSRVLVELYHIFRDDRRKKVIFIIESNKLSELIEDCDVAKLTPSITEAHDREFTLNDLCFESQNILLERTVNFQGNAVVIKNLLHNRHQTLIDTHTLTKLVKNEEIKIGNQLPELGEIKNYFVKRSFHINKEIAESIFDESDDDDNNAMSDLFFVSGCLDGLRSSNLKLHKLVQNSWESEDQQFSKLCAENPDLNIHWLKRENGMLFWVQTKGSICSLSKHRIPYRHRKYSLDNVLFENVRQKVMIISDVAGMGKSTLMTYLGQKIKKVSTKNNEIWIERIDLNDFNVELSELNDKKEIFNFDTKKATTFLIFKIFKFENIFEQNLFAKYIETEGMMTLLVDGFDEISPVYTDVVVDLLKTLKESHLNRLFVTTRPSSTTILEDQLCVFSHSMVPFSEENKSDFLVNFWRHKFNLMDDSEEQRLDDFAKAVTKKLSVSLNERETAFTGVPLQMRMVAEIVPENKNFEEIDLPETFDILTLYERFIEKKYSIYKKEKVKPITAVAEDAVEQSRLVSVEIHQKFALHSLFPNEFSRLLSEDEVEDLESYISKISKGQERTGIVNRAQIIRNTTRLLFIHRSFSEFFVADFIMTKLNRKKQNLEVHKFLLTEILVTQLNELIRIFLNAKLARQSVGVIVLKKCGELITDFWLSSPEKICTENEETILHLAVKEINEEIIKFILSCLKDHHILKKFIDNEDKNGNSAIQETAKIGNAKVLEWLVENGANVNSVDNDGKTVLYYALRYSHSNLVDFLIKHEADIKSVDILNLYSYLDYGPRRLDVIKMLVNNGGDIKVEDKHGETLLHYAAEQGDTDLIHWLIEEGKANVNDEDSDGTKLIHRSASSDQWELVKWLIQCGNADANVKDRVGNTLLHYAAFKGRLDIVKWLAKPRNDGGGGADISSLGELGSSVLHDAAISGNLPLVEWLIKSDEEGGGGLDVNAVDGDGKTPLHEAAFFGHLDLVRWLVKAQEDGGVGADANIEDSEGQTALYSAACFGQLELVLMLLDKTDISHMTDKEGRTVLHVAAAFGEVKLMDKLLGKGIAGVITKDSLGRSALHYAAEHNNREVVELLLNYGARVDCRDNKGRQAVHYAASTGTNDIETWLGERYINVDVVMGLEGRQAHKIICFTLSPHQKHMAKFLNDKLFDISDNEDQRFHLTINALSTLELLLQHGANINAADDGGRTALYEAVFLPERSVVGWDVVQWLMRPTVSGGGGADVNAIDTQGRTVIHEMAKHGERGLLEDWLELLPDAASVVNSKDKDGRTPLHEAANNFSTGQTSVIKLLIENGAVVYTPDNDGRTALHEASRYDHLDCVKFMLESVDDTQRQAFVNIEDNYGRTALHDACAAGNLQLAKNLVLNNADVNSKDKDGWTPLHYADKFNKLKVVRWLMDNKGCHL